MQSVGIVGGGIAGLALAAALDPESWRVTVYEERPDRPPAGTALGMWPAAMRALARIGADAEVRRRSVTIDTVALRDGAGRPIAVQRAPEAHLVARPELLSALRAVQHPATVRRTARIDSATELLAEHDIVVGADGVHSVIRRSVFGGSSVRAGWVVVRGTAGLRRREMTEYWHNGMVIGVTPVFGDRTNFYVAIPETPSLVGIEDWTPGQALDLARHATKDMPAELARTFEAANPADVLHQRLWVSPVRLRNHAGRVVLIGDAAHAMNPNLGRGACEALVDAVCLGSVLNRHRSPRALAAYGFRRALPGQAVKVASRLTRDIASVRHGAGVRDRLIRTLTRPGDR